MIYLKGFLLVMGLGLGIPLFAVAIFRYWQFALLVMLSALVLCIYAAAQLFI